MPEKIDRVLSEKQPEVIEMPEATQPEVKEEQEKQELRKKLIKVAQDFLVDNPAEVDVENLSDEDLGELIQQKFQKNLESFFKSSGLEEEIKQCKTDENVLHLLARKKGTEGWVDMVPNLIKANEGAGMNCTMNSAMMHMALEKMGFNKIRTVLVSGHHVVLRELEDGSIKLYDAGNKSTINGELLGYTHTFLPEQIINKEEIEEKNGRKGFKFTLNRGQMDEWGGFHTPDQEGNFKRKLYAYDSSIKMDVSIALDNLAYVKQDAQELGGATDRGFIEEDEYLRAVADFLRKNNETELSNEDLMIIVSENEDTKKEFIKAAAESVIKGAAIPNPYDYIKSTLLKPKSQLTEFPNPAPFAQKAIERHEQAKKLCAEYPELNTLDVGKIFKQFGLFNAEDFIK